MAAMTSFGAGKCWHQSDEWKRSVCRAPF